MKSNFRYLLIAALVAVDQVVKLIVRNYRGSDVNLIGDFIYFRPTHNTYYSWYNSMLGIENTKAFHIILTSAILVLAILLFRYAYNRKGNKIETRLLEIFMLSFR
ncbi:signal peptidase II [Proteinivorax hydrogeniformans]|uniref:Signal peptidase II n=1 Tax=Proteinivorax hydrogeniformans TaxID=1826727 RepID=A0AAU8HQD4_9FIRM